MTGLRISRQRPAILTPWLLSAHAPRLGYFRHLFVSDRIGYMDRVEECRQTSVHLILLRKCLESMLTAQMVTYVPLRKSV